MKISLKLFILLIFIVLAISTSAEYPWLNKYEQSYTIVGQIEVPGGYERIDVSPHSFQDWLRHLPLKEAKTPVYLYNGRKKSNQAAHFAVIDMDIGNKDLQQCADAIIRLRAEYLYAKHEYEVIHFNFTNGDTASFKKWIAGYRPVVKGNTVQWRKSQTPDSSYTNFRKYLNIVFTYAGSYSLSKELQTVQDVHDMRIGDVFIKGGFPGHAVIVVDMAIHPSTGKKLFLLAQSYMPAQDIHVLKNPTNKILDPWYDIDFGQTLHTPEWTFSDKQLKRFR
jgi:hypothetical protein